MSEKTEDEYESVEWTDTDKFWFEWWRDAPKLNISLLRDLLGRTITLSASLAGGSAAFLDEKLLPPALRGLVVSFFLASLIAACWGIIPKTEVVEPCLEQIRESKERAIVRMRNAFIISVVAMSMAFGLILLGWIVNLCIA